MNSLLKILSRVSGLSALLVIALAGMAVSNTSAAGEKKKSGDSFQLSLSNKVYTGDPESKFVRQTCTPDKGKQASVQKQHILKKKKHTAQ